MNNRTRRHQHFSPAEISRVLTLYRRSGLGVAQFAQEHGIRPGRLHYWIYEKGRAKAGKPTQALVGKAVFQELKVATMLPAFESWAADVRMPGGVAARFSQEAAAARIGWVVQALRRRC